MEIGEKKVDAEFVIKTLPSSCCIRRSVTQPTRISGPTDRITVVNGTNSAGDIRRQRQLPDDGTAGGSVWHARVDGAVL